MRNFILSAISILVLALGMSSAHSAAPDFTFRVPVTLENLVNADRIRVKCVVSSAPASRTDRFTSRYVMGRGEAERIIRGERFIGTLTVVVNAEGLTPASDAKSYQCLMEVMGTSTATGVRYVVTSPASYNRATGHTLERSRNPVRGSIP